MTSDPRITPLENGPLMATDLPEIRDVDGETIKGGARMPLCRCGRSTRKPFCDGSHKMAGFSSAPDTANIRNTPITYTGHVEGTEVTVHYTPVLCSHAAECVKASAAIFDPARKPFVALEKGTMADLLTAISKCPSGALRLEVGDTAPQHMVNGDVEVVVERNGPYRVRNVALDAEFNGAGASRTKYVLCRCGHSKNKPFCDGSHYDAGWKDGAP